MNNWYLRSKTAERLRKTSQIVTIGPVYHGTVENFKIEDFRGDVKYFTENQNFAGDYARQKSFERQMDADIKIIAAYVRGNVFDPQNKTHIEAVVPFCHH